MKFLITNGFMVILIKYVNIFINNQYQIKKYKKCVMFFNTKS